MLSASSAIDVLKGTVMGFEQNMEAHMPKLKATEDVSN
jgi:hypothetical protein